jgi:hypothetical protein
MIGRVSRGVPGVKIGRGQARGIQFSELVTLSGLTRRRLTPRIASEGSRSGVRDASLVFSGNEDRAADPLTAKP